MDHRAENKMLEKIDILSFVRDIVKEWWVILLLSISVSLFANVWVNNSYEPEYTVTSTFVVSKKGMNGSIYQNLSSSKEIAERFSLVLDSTILKKKIAEELGMEEFTAKTSAQVLPETNLMELTVTAKTAMEAYHVMHSIMENYDMVSDYVIENIILEVIQPPLIPDAPSNTVDARSAMKKSFVVAVFICALGIAGISYIRDTVKNENDVKEKLDTKLLGSIYHERKAKSFREIRKSKEFSMLVNNPLLSFRFVESNKMTAAKIRTYMDQRHLKTVLITSVIENEGKSTVSANVALSLAQEGKKVVLIDFDFRKPAQYKIFEVPKDKTENLPELLESGKGFEKLVKQHGDSGLYAIFNSVTTKSIENLVENGNLRKIIRFFEDKVDYIIIDSSPLAVVSDTEEIAQMADASILVVRQDRVLAKDINDAIDVLNKTNGKVMGCIFNDATPGFTGSTSHYRYGGHYGKRTE